MELDKTELTLMPMWMPVYPRWDDYPLSEEKGKGISIKNCPDCCGSGLPR